MKNLILIIILLGGSGSICAQTYRAVFSKTFYLGIGTSPTGGVTVSANPASSPYALQLPLDDGDANQVLTTDGAGILSWTTPGGGGLSLPYSNSTSNASTLFDLSNTGAGGSITAATNSTTDEISAIRGTVSGNASTQVIGLWGRANSDNAANTGTIGVLASGSGRSTTGQTNIALQISGGEFTIGRTVEDASTSYSTTNASAGGTYSSDGPSGVIVLETDEVVTAQIDPSKTQVGSFTLTNRYIKTSSIILVNVVGIANAGGTPNLEEASISLQVRSRAAGSCVVQVGITLDENATGGAVLDDGDDLTIGYIVINPSR